MKFDPMTKEVFADNGALIKQLNCPFRMHWDNLEATKPTMRKCAVCDRFIVDTALFTDDQLLEMVGQNPDTCLKIDLHQPNLQIISNALLG
jgi:hypothetical protein